jgi:hypothetical protein
MSELPGMWDESDLQGGLADCDEDRRQSAQVQSEPTRKWCNKCGYTGLSAVHENCGYEAIPFEKAPAAAIPVGWQLVPIKPTVFMVQQSGRPTVAKFTYEAMLAAAPKPAPIEVTDELLIDLYDHSHDDEWVGHDVSTEALRRIVQRAFKHVGLEVKL